MRSKRKRRELHAGTVLYAGGDVLILRPARGAVATYVEQDGSVSAELPLPDAAWAAKVGARLIVCGRSVEETAMVVVELVRPDRALECTLLAGMLPEPGIAGVLFASRR